MEQNAANQGGAKIAAGAFVVRKDKVAVEGPRAVRRAVAVTELVAVHRMCVVRMGGGHLVTRCGANEAETDPHSCGCCFSCTFSSVVFLEFDFHLVAEKYGDLSEPL